MSEIIITTLKPEFADELALLQRICLPTVGENDRLSRDHFLKHCELFPEGNFVAISTDNQKLVGLGSGFLINFDFENPQHDFSEMIGYGYYTNHNPDGEWYYGADITVHPQYRRRGIGALLYEARKNVIKRLNRKGLVAGGLIPGFSQYKHKMSAEEYANKVASGELYDSTLSFQLAHEFKLYGVLENYIDDAASDNWATLIVWENPDYQP